jgi:mono/diheme cytochrome c family protein
MAKILLLSCVALFVVTLAGSPATLTSNFPSPSDPQGALDGAQLYRTYCASCHGTSARGDGPLADVLRRRPSDLTTLRQRYHGFPTELLTRIVDGRQAVRGHGSIEMPVWGDTFRSGNVSDEAVDQKILALVQYLEAIQARNSH